MTIEQAIVIALLGCVLGVLGGVLGTGGGTFAIPTLVLCMAYSQKAAQGTALVMVVANVLKALFKYRQQSGLDLRLALTLATSGLFSSTVSAYWSLAIDGPRLRFMYGCFLLFLAVMVWALQTFKREKIASLNWYWSVVPGLIGGICLGLFGVGGAMLAVPLLVLFHDQTQVRAQGLGLALAVPGCLMALLQYSAAGWVDWGPGLLMAVGGLCGVSTGVSIAHRLNSNTLNRVFCCFLVVAAMGMIIS
jgi:uncharacterized membrane protein YfcA